MKSSNESTNEAIPLSYQQQQLWLFEQLYPNTNTYNVPIVVELHGRIGVLELRAAFNRIVERHPMLRTRFVSSGSSAHQVIEPQASVEFDVVDVTLDVDAKAHIESDVASLTSQPFNLVAQPPLRIRVYLSERKRATLFMLVHHIIADGWSIGLIVKELGECYEAYLAGTEPTLPPLEVQYADIVRLQHERFGKEPMQDDGVAKWREMFADCRPLDAPAPVTVGLISKRRSRTFAAVLSDSLTERVRMRAQHARVTPFSILTSAVALVYARYDRSEGVVLGIPFANRMQRGAERIVGHFVNVMPLPFPVDQQLTGDEFLHFVQRRLWTALAAQDVPIQAVREHATDSGSDPPSVRAVLNYQGNGDAEFLGEACRLELVRVSSPATKFDLTMTFVERPSGIAIDVEYLEDTVTQEQVGVITSRIELTLHELCARGTARLSDLSLLAEGEREMLMRASSGDLVDFPASLCAHRLFEEQVEAHPSRTALISDIESLSYGELNTRANRLGRELQELGVRRGAKVGLLGRRSPRVFVGLLAILKAGACYVPLDPSYPRDRLRFMVEDSGAFLILADGELGLNHCGATRLFGAETIPVARAEENAADKSCLNIDDPMLGSTDLAYVIYTSGSTGKPKGTEIEHRGVCNLAFAQRRHFGVSPECRVLQFSSLSFDASVFEVTWALCSGATLYLPPPDLLLAGDTLESVTATAGITHALLPPAVLGAMPEHARLEKISVLLTGGEAPSAALVRRWGRDRRFFNVYGPTEATVAVAFHECDPHDSEDPPIGRPFINTRLYILDRSGALCPPGIVGELHIAGKQLARGYLNRPVLERTQFVRGALVSTERLYKTGDLARYKADGTIAMCGRVDNQVKIRGFRIELGEIEACLLEHESVQSCAVLSREGASGSKILVAFYTQKPARPGAAEGELRTHVLERLPRFMLPSIFVEVEELPLTTNGKVDRNALLGLFKEAGRADFEPPAGAPERLVAAAFCDVLRLERVGRSDNFFDLGGHSLLAASLLARIREAATVDVSLPHLFANPTVKGLASIVAGTGEARMVPFATYLRKSPIPQTVCLFPTLFGLSSHYDSFAKLLEFGGSIKACRLPGSVHGESPLESFDSIVEHCRTYLLDDPSVRYTLVGWSFGGAVAHELACRLREETTNAPELVLIDTYDQTGKSLNEESAEELFRSHLGYHSGSASDLLIPVYQASLHALTTHNARRYDGALYEIRAEQSATLVAEGALTPFVADRRHVEILSGDHFSLFNDRLLPQLAGAITRALHAQGEQS